MTQAALTSFVLGLFSSASPCVLPLYPGFIAYLGGQTDADTDAGKRQYLFGFLILAGVLTMMLALGGFIALLAVPIGRTLAFAIPLADALIFLLGVLLLLDINPFKTLPQVQVPVLNHPLLNAYVYGLCYGPLTLPCSGPLLVSIFAVSLTLGEAMSNLWVFLWFGLGLGVPLLILSLLSGAYQKQLARQLARHARLINIIGGVLLIGIALYDLYKNWSMIRLFFA
jgi:cytochrome c-type biogenesis protein